MARLHKAWHWDLDLIQQWELLLLSCDLKGWRRHFLLMESVSAGACNDSEARVSDGSSISFYEQVKAKCYRASPLPPVWNWWHGKTEIWQRFSGWPTQASTQMQNRAEKEAERETEGDGGCIGLKGETETDGKKKVAGRNNVLPCQKRFWNNNLNTPAQPAFHHAFQQEDVYLFNS